MTHTGLVLDRPYFRLSFRGARKNPEDGLRRLPDGSFVDVRDGSRWERRELYDFGSGNESGFMRLTALAWEDLWELILRSNLKDNRYGTAAVLEQQYPGQLLSALTRLLADSRATWDPQIKEALQILDLEVPVNRCEVIGKSPLEVQDEYERWKWVSDRVRRILASP